MDGQNFVELQGKIMWPELKIVGDGYKLFKAKLAIPIEGHDGKFQYLKIAGWRAIADALGELPTESFIKVHAHIEERRYDGKCKHCGEAEQKYWTECIVDNFVLVKNE